MFSPWRVFLPAFALLLSTGVAQEEHSHPAPGKLGRVSFSVSCKAEVQPDFNRAVALLHSFTYSAARDTFRSVSQKDPSCAMAHWGIAMSYYHQLWEPAIVPGSNGQQEIEQARRIAAKTERERGFIEAAGLLFQNADTTPYDQRALRYENAMSGLATANPRDAEVQTFYALALLANASPADKTHARQKKAANLLEPIYTANPDHPGAAHYLIHACDNAEMASRGLPAARAYAQIAPAAPHALHMPSHIFTRLGLWDDSIASNTAARHAAEKAGDTGEQLHAMDYLVYAYLQKGEYAPAAEVIEQLKAMPKPSSEGFKVGYAAVAMPVRYAVERSDWDAAATITPPSNAPPHVTAIAVWARGIGLARSGHPEDTVAEIATLQHLQEQLQGAGNDYWARQVGILKREVMAWSSHAQHKNADALVLLRETADDEDAVEKLPVTPGPIVPAREQLGYMLLEQGQPDLAAAEFKTVLTNSPGRRGAIAGAAESAGKASAGTAGTAHVFSANRCGAQSSSRTSPEENTGSVYDRNSSAAPKSGR
jgi:hypothetical protein